MAAHVGGVAAPRGALAGMGDAERVREEGSDPLLQLAAERDFRSQVQDVPAFAERILGQFEVDFRLPGTGDAVQVGRAPGSKMAADGRTGFFLGRRQADGGLLCGEGLRRGRILVGNGRQGGPFRAGSLLRFGVPALRLFAAGAPDLFVQCGDARVQPRSLGPAPFIPLGPQVLFPLLAAPVGEGLVVFHACLPGGIGGLVHFSDRTEVVVGDLPPEGDLFFRNGRQFRSDPSRGFDPFRRDAGGRRVRGRNADDARVRLPREVHFDPGPDPDRRPCGVVRKGVDRLPREAERQDDVYVGNGRHRRFFQVYKSNSFL